MHMRFYYASSPAVKAEPWSSITSGGSSRSMDALPLPAFEAFLSEAAGYGRLRHDEDAASSTPPDSDHQNTPPPPYQRRETAPDHHLLTTHAVHYNTCTSDLASWVDSMLSQLVSSDNPLDRSYYNYLQSRASLDPHQPPRLQVHSEYPPLTEEDTAVPLADDSAAIRLVHVLMACAESVHLGNHADAAALVAQCRSLLLSSQLQATSAFDVIAKVADCFIDALTRRIFCGCSPFPSTSDRLPLGQMAQRNRAAETEQALLYNGFYEAAPYLKFAHFTANQAILEAVIGRPAVHVVDLALPDGGMSASALLRQWPALMQALALRPGGPPFLRLTLVCASHAEQLDVRTAGERLRTLARSLGVCFKFQEVQTRRLEDVQPWMIIETPDDDLCRVNGETVAVNCALQLHRLLASDGEEAGEARVGAVLQWLRALQPAVVAVAEQEADHNKFSFLGRFTDALFYYSTVFDSLEAFSRGGGGNPAAIQAAEGYLRGEIRNVVCCDGTAREERHEPLAMWRCRMGRAGFQPANLGSGALRQARMLLALLAGPAVEGYEVQEDDGCLFLGWHGRPLFSASAWKPAVWDQQDSKPQHHVGSVDHKAAGNYYSLAVTSDGSAGDETRSFS